MPLYPSFQYVSQVEAPLVQGLPDQEAPAIWMQPPYVAPKDIPVAEVLPDLPMAENMDS